ncbi:hypothetical protein HK096_001972, partial [Nowakowskiella sp. JEL0078]
QMVFLVLYLLVSQHKRTLDDDPLVKEPHYTATSTNVMSFSLGKSTTESDASTA